jgi:hypothetical protein
MTKKERVHATTWAGTTMPVAVVDDTKHIVGKDLVKSWRTNSRCGDI